MITGFKTKRIKTTTLGERLKLSRTRKEKTLLDAEEATKVRARYLEALESDSFENLPASVYAIGFLERYCDFLHLPKSKYLIEFKRSLATWQSMQKQPLSPRRSVREQKIIITPKIIFGFTATLVVTVMVGYIWIQLLNLTAPPKLEIITPKEETKVAIDKIEITGKTDPGATIEINHQKIAQDKEGNFKETVALDNGINTLEVVAINRFQKQSTKTVQVLRTTEVN